VSAVAKGTPPTLKVAMRQLPDSDQRASLEHDVDWFGTARARIGYAADGWLAYATGGYAFGRVALKGTATGAGVNVLRSRAKPMPILPPTSIDAAMSQRTKPLLDLSWR
jgi:opacity protein-like surface antigen